MNAITLPHQFFLDRFGGRMVPASRGQMEDIRGARSELYKGKVRLHHDWEWYSELDIKQFGVSRVSRHSSTDALMCAYAFGDGDVQQWVPEEGEPIPKDLEDAIRDPDVWKFSWNKPAEYCTWKNVLGIDIPHEQWVDPMVLAYSLSLPGKLEKAGKVVDIPEDKQKQANGLRLINIFSKPQKPTKARPYSRRTYVTDPELWEEFKGYNRNDVEAERAIWKRLRKWDLPEDEWALWYIDQDINERGIPINLRVVRNAMSVIADLTGERIHKMKVITDLANPNSGPQLLPWLRERGYPYEDLKKGHVAKHLKELEADPTPENKPVRAVLAMRQDVSKASVKKYAALNKRTDTDGFLRYAFQFAGAGRTWRWAGRGYQAQNLAKPDPSLEKEEQQAAAVHHLEWLDAEALELIYPKPFALLSTCVRPVAQAIPGMTFVDADLSAIENIVLGWMSSCAKILNVFEQGLDPYLDFAQYLFGMTYAELEAEFRAGMKKRRTTSKPGVLGCGYMLGAGEAHENPNTGEMEASGLLGYAWNMGVTDFTQEDSTKSVKVWRSTFVECVDFWYEIDRAMRRCIKTGRPTECWPVRFDRSGPWLRMHLPSGRCLHYCRPRIEMRKMPWGDMKESITYEGLNDKNQWARLSTHPGKITENADQAIARDILANGMRIAKKEFGLDLRIHVHDQLVAMVGDGSKAEALEILMECMKRKPRWARDIPLNVAGFATPIFIKD